MIMNGKRMVWKVDIVVYFWVPTRSGRVARVEEVNGDIRMITSLGWYP
jgi:hypothetical protein